MVGIGSNVSLSTVSTYPLEKEGLLLMRKKSTCNFMVSKNFFKMGRTGIHCKLPAHSHGSGVEDNPRGKNLSLSSTNKMEEYNTAMKRMMRNPYEYHHDLGQLVSLFPCPNYFLLLIFIFYFHLRFWCCVCSSVSVCHCFVFFYSLFLWWIASRENVEVGGYIFLGSSCFCHTMKFP